MVKSGSPIAVSYTHLSTSTQPSSDAAVSLEEAKQAALTHAGVSADLSLIHIFYIETAAPFIA